MAREKKYLVWLHYSLTHTKRNENPKIKESVTSVETWDTILPFSAKDDGAAREFAQGLTEKGGGRSKAADIFINGIWEVARQVPTEVPKEVVNR